MNLEELRNFLKEANKATYANKNAKKTPPSRLASDDYHFEKGDLVYHDTYFGSRDFIGEEIVYKNNVPIWGMNYYGYVLDENVNERDIYNFLRTALMEEYEDIIPARGPKVFNLQEMKYTNSVEGGLGRFNGTEEIETEDKVIYRALYHGGFIE